MPLGVDCGVTQLLQICWIIQKVMDKGDDSKRRCKSNPDPVNIIINISPVEDFLEPLGPKSKTPSPRSSKKKSGSNPTTPRKQRDSERERHKERYGGEKEREEKHTERERRKEKEKEKQEMTEPPCSQQKELEAVSVQEKKESPKKRKHNAKKEKQRETEEKEEKEGRSRLSHSSDKNMSYKLLGVLSPSARRRSQMFQVGELDREREKAKERGKEVSERENKAEQQNADTPKEEDGVNLHRKDSRGRASAMLCSNEEVSVKKEEKPTTLAGNLSFTFNSGSGMHGFPCSSLLSS